MYDLLRLITWIIVIILILITIIHLSSKYPSTCGGCSENMISLDYRSTPKNYDYNYDDYWAWKQIEKFESGFIPYISKGIYDDYLF